MADQNAKKGQNEMTLVYKQDKSEINIFGGEFVSRCIDNCYLMIDGEKKDLSSKITCTKEQMIVQLIET